MEIKKNVEVQDHEGNIYHPHTSAKVVFLEDGKNVESQLAQMATEMESVKQSGVNAKSKMVTSINSKNTVPDVTVNDTWNTMAQRVADIKEGSGNAQPNHVLSPYTFTNSEGIEKTGTIPSKSATTITPGTANQVINAGQYLCGAVTILGDTDLIASNIRKNANIFNVVGTYIGFENFKVTRIKTILANGVGSYTVPLTGIDTSKSIVTTKTYCFSENPYACNTSILARFENGNLILERPNYSGYSEQIEVVAEIITFENIFKLLQGVTALTGIDNSITHNGNIDWNKSAIFYTTQNGGKFYNRDSNSVTPFVYEFNGNTIKVKVLSLYSDTKISWQIIQFKS